jgi:hypothetical protein
VNAPPARAARTVDVSRHRVEIAMRARISAVIAAACLLAIAAPAFANMLDVPLGQSYPGISGYSPQYDPQVCDRITRFCFRP